MTVPELRVAQALERSSATEGAKEIQSVSVSAKGHAEIATHACRLRSAGEVPRNPGTYALFADRLVSTR
jgi:hypothetical protein